MATIHLHQTTSATPEQFLAGLTDFGPGHSMTTTDVNAVAVCQGKNIKGLLFEVLLATGGKRVMGKALATTVTAIEARNYQPRQAQS
jgi:hypothetical protein